MPLITTKYDPTICQCCGASTTSDVLCVCSAYPDWHMNEHGDVRCGYHKAELFLPPERIIQAVGVPNLQSNDRYRNYRHA